MKLLLGFLVWQLAKNRSLSRAYHRAVSFHARESNCVSNYSARVWRGQCRQKVEQIPIRGVGRQDSCNKSA